MKILCACLILVGVITSKTASSQQKQVLETFKYSFTGWDKPDIRLITNEKMKKIKHTHQLLKGGIWDELFPNMVYIPQATYAINNVDSSDKKKKYLAVNSFFMLNTEVTNKMYKYFLQDSSDKKYMPHFGTDPSIANADLANRFEVKSNGKTYTLSNYLELDNYPVVGITSEATNAFCKWLTRKAMQSLDYKNDKLLVAGFHLPDEAEFEAATVMNLVDENATEEELNKVFAEELKGNKARAKINYGQIAKADGSIERKYDEDGFYFTNPVKEFRAGKMGLFGMQGNAAEWTMDRCCLDRIFTLKDIQALDRNPNLERVIKGGSWFDTPFYLQPWVRQKYNSKKSSERIGFRVVIMDI